MRLLDTNILVYAHGSPHPYKEPCRALIARTSESPSEYNIDTELLQEIMHVYNVRGNRAFGLAIFDVLMNIFPDPIPITRYEMVVARRLMEEYSALSPRDAIHAAVVQTQELEGIVTTDMVFRQVRGVTAFDPRDLASSL